LGRRVALSCRLRAADLLSAARFALAARRRIMMPSDSVACLRRSHRVSGPSLRARALDQSTPRRHEGCDPASRCRHGYLRMHSTRSPRNGARWPSVEGRIFSTCTTVGAGGATTTKSNSSIACVRRSAWLRDGPRSLRGRWVNLRRRKVSPFLTRPPAPLLEGAASRRWPPIPRTWTS